MIEPGRSGAYVALFSEIGLVLFVTTLAGILAGYWLDQQLDSVPIFVILGFGLGITCGGLASYRLISRFLARLDR